MVNIASNAQLRPSEPLKDTYATESQILNKNKRQIADVKKTPPDEERFCHRSFNLLGAYNRGSLAQQLFEAP